MVEKLTEIFPEDALFFRGFINSDERLDNLLIYADWLDQMNDPLRADIVRLQIKMANMFPGSHHYLDMVESRQKLLQRLNAEFEHAKQWVAAIGFGAIEGCLVPEGKQCPRRWENLPLVNDDPTVRLCHFCNKITHYCDSIKEAQDRFQSDGRVTVDPGVPRKRSDLNPRELG